MNHNSYYSIFNDFSKKIDLIKKYDKAVVLEVDLRKNNFLKDNNIKNNSYLIRNEVSLIKKSIKNNN
jgi:uncharacterized membrane protein